MKKGTENIINGFGKMVNKGTLYILVLYKGCDNRMNRNLVTNRGCRHHPRCRCRRSSGGMVSELNSNGFLIERGKGGGRLRIEIFFLPPRVRLIYV